MSIPIFLNKIMKLSTSIKDFVLLNYDQINIYSKYLSYDYDTIRSCIINRHNIINTHREGDTKASLTFYYKNEKLIMWDFGDTLYRGDIFDAVGIYLNKNSNKSNDFIEICSEIISNNETKVIVNTLQPEVSSGTLSYIPKDFSKFDLNYWKQGNIGKAHLVARGVTPAKAILFNNTPLYSNTENDPTYIYQLGHFDNTDVFKSYRPLTDNPKLKFKVNRQLTLEGINELYTSDVLIITKSRKDKLTIEANLDGGIIANKVIKLVKQLNYPPFITYSFFKGFYDELYNIKHRYCITNVSSESTFIPPELVELLYTKHKDIIINYDYDIAGILNAYTYVKLYNFKSVFIGRDSDSIISKFDPKLLRLIHNKFESLDITFDEDDLMEFILEHSGRNTAKDWFELSTYDNTYCKKLLNANFC